jgi:hypothetical protein
MQDTPAFVHLYRYLTREKKHAKGPVASWLARDPDAAPVLLSAARMLDTPPSRDSCGLSEGEMLALLDAPTPLRALEHILNSRDGRAFLSGLASWYDPAPSAAMVKRIAAAGRARALPRSTSILYRIAVTNAVRTGRLLLELIRVPEPQAQVALAFRSKALRTGTTVESLPFYFDNGLSFALSFERTDKGPTTLHLRKFVYNEDREIATATLNGKAMRIENGEATISLTKLPSRLKLAVRETGEAARMFGCEIDGAK